MSESTLSRQWADIFSEVGFLIGYGRTSANWDAGQLADISYSVQAGLSRFYWPLRPEGGKYAWTFLRPMGQLVSSAVTSVTSGVPVYTSGTNTSLVTFASITNGAVQARMSGFATLTFATSGKTYPVSAAVDGGTTVVLTGNASAEHIGDSVTFSIQQDFDLPDDYGRILGDLTIFDNHRMHCVVKQRSEYEVTRARANTNTNPQASRMYAIRQKFPFAGATSGERWEIMLYPTPDTAYTFQYRYEVLANMLTSAAPYPYGGAAHADTILAACQAEAARLFKPSMSPAMESRWQERLRASLDMDQQTIPNFGYNGDPSNNKGGAAYNSADWMLPAVEYVGGGPFI